MQINRHAGYSPLRTPEIDMVVTCGLMVAFGLWAIASLITLSYSSISASELRNADVAKPEALLHWKDRNISLEKFRVMIRAAPVGGSINSPKEEKDRLLSENAVVLFQFMDPASPGLEQMLARADQASGQDWQLVTVLVDADPQLPSLKLMASSRFEGALLLVVPEEILESVFHEDLWNSWSRKEVLSIYLVMVSGRVVWLGSSPQPASELALSIAGAVGSTFSQLSSVRDKSMPHEAERTVEQNPLQRNLTELETACHISGTPPELSQLSDTIYSSRQLTETTLAVYIATLRKPTVVNFWATWCLPCIEEMPILATLAGENRGVQFVGIADSDRNPESVARVSKVLSEAGVAYPNYISPSRDLQLKVVGSTILPAFAFFDKHGVMEDCFIGSLSSPEHEFQFSLWLSQVGGGG